ncbi:hypothetical protein [Cytobacillus gottheilii]|uniref:Group-specific protein n=1 Tax=Cytobacillus gottheilii TaxID=859144 RepID=A0ABX8FAE7_9BACI|nr:hypothetical protein [Cytobacillus gottheilii]QVY60446.1 hypothetical protein J1899_15690 [Cytobacillus gottheilii]
MEIISNEDQFECLKSMQSTIKKLEKAYAQMNQKGANTTLVKKRLDACKIGLAMLENVWNEVPHSHSHTELAGAQKVLLALTPSVESSYAKSKAGSPQRTLLERRLKALDLVDEAIKDQISMENS